MQYCSQCGSPVEGGTAFCTSCGTAVKAQVQQPENSQQPPMVAAYPAVPVYPPPNQYSPGAPYPPQGAQQPYAVYQNGQPVFLGVVPPKQQKLSGIAKAWCWFGIIVNFISVGLTAAADVHEDILALAMLTGLLAVAGYITVLCAKKPGIFILCGAAALSMVLNFAFGEYGQAFLKILAPAITWMFIHESWSQWGKAGASDPMAGAYSHMDPQKMYFTQHGRKYRIWSIVNACLFFMLVMPFFAIVQSHRAENATNMEEHQRHIQWALILNLATYGVVGLVSVINGLVSILA